MKTRADEFSRPKFFKERLVKYCILQLIPEMLKTLPTPQYILPYQNQFKLTLVLLPQKQNKKSYPLRSTPFEVSENMNDGDQT